MSAGTVAERRTGFDRRVLTASNDHKVAPGIYHYRGHAIAKDKEGTWHVSQPTTDFHDTYKQLARARKAIDARIAEAERLIKEQAKAQGGSKRGGRTKAPKKVRATSGRVSLDTVKYIRDKMEPYFTPGGPRGKVKAYQELALELGLGIETIARIARGDTYADVG